MVAVTERSKRVASRRGAVAHETLPLPAPSTASVITILIYSTSAIDNVDRDSL